MRDMDSESQWYDDGDLIIHYPGMSNEDRIKKFKALMNGQISFRASLKTN
jgi:hypothetical protein